MNEVKVTKKDRFNALISAFKGETNFADLDAEDFISFCEKEVANLEKKAATAKASAAKKRAESDAMTDAIAQALTDEFQSIASLVSATDCEDVTPSKVAYRANKLVEDGVAEKGEVEEGDKGRKVVAFRRVQIAD